MAMDGGERSSPTGGGRAGLLPLFAPSPPNEQAAESVEEKLRRVSEENRRLAVALDAILVDRPHPAASRNAAVTVEPTPRVRTVRARAADPADADADAGLLKDGYQWRKYGQKVTRDNPYPRAYFRCAYAPSCPVKKKVQRSAEDRSMLVATYEGEHNHAQSAQSEFVCDASTSRQQAGSSSLPCSISIGSSGRTITLDLQDQACGSRAGTMVSGEVATPEFRKVLVDELVNLLKNDSEFMESLTSAVAARMMERVIPERINQ